MEKLFLLLVAMGEGNRVIGDGTGMPDWDLKDDRISFAKKTIADATDNIVIQGRKSYEALPDGFRPLPRRVNIVITRDRSWVPKESGVIVVYSLEEAIEVAKSLPGKVVSIIGGGEIYLEAIRQIIFDKMYITTVKGHFEGSVRFPDMDFIFKAHYIKTDRIDFVAQSDRNSHDFFIEEYSKKNV